MKIANHYLLVAVCYFTAIIAGLTSCGGNDDSGKADQTISFSSLTPHNLSEQSFELNATASSGLPVSFTSSDPTIATVSEKTVHLLKSGTIFITASQSGNDAYFEAPSVRQKLVINSDNDPDKKNQTITFDLSVSEWKYSQGELTLEATASSGLPVTFTTTHPFVSITGNTLNLIYTGTHYDNEAVIVASQAGNAEYNAAPNVSKTLHVSHDN